MKAILDVKTDSYVTQIFRLDGNIFLSDRNHHWQTPTESVDVFSNCWSVVFGDYKEGDLGFIRAGETQLFNGKWVFLIPPFSIIQWQINHSPLIWKSYTALTPPPENFPKVASAFRLDEFPSIDGRPELVDFINLTPEKLTLINKCEDNNYVACKVKSYIDCNFSQDHSIGDVAKKLSFSHSVMSRYFKRNYSLSIVQYRNQLRLFNTLIELLHANSSIQSVAQNSGHKDLSKFYRRFRDFFRTSPSSYSYEVSKKRNNRDVST